MTSHDPLLLIPGMMCDSRLFTPQIDAFSHDRLVAVAAIVGGTIPDMAANILRQAPPRFALAGLSMGGIIAMELMAQAPDRISRLALLDTNPLAELAAVSAKREPQIAAVLAGHLQRVMSQDMFPKYLADGADHQPILDTCMAMAQTAGADTFERQSRALMSRPDQQHTLRSVTVPTLILCGAEDALCPLHRHELMAELIPDAALSVIPHAGHLPTLEQPELTNKALAKWLT